MITRNVSSRKKACRRCTEAKARCEGQRPICARCKSKGLACLYFTAPAPNAAGAGDIPSAFNDDGIQYNVVSQLATPPAAESERAIPLSPEGASNFNAPATSRIQPFAAQSVPPEVQYGTTATAAASPQAPDPPLQATIPPPNNTPASSVQSSYDTHGPTTSAPILDFSAVQLVSTTDISRIRNRWLESFLPSVGRRAKVVHPHTIQYLSVVLKSWPRQMLRPGQLPPFIHPLQVVGHMPQALANCYSLVRMWEGMAEGSEAMVTDTVQREMKRLLDEHENYSQMNLLAAFQAYLIYTIMTFFSPAQNIPPLVDHTITSNLEELASRTSQTGLLCEAELLSARPSWEAWVVASAKRRTLVATYQFENVFNYVNENPMYVSEELRDLPMPASRALWEAKERVVWEREYDRHLTEWAGRGEVTMSESWRPPDDASEASLAERRRRLEKWVETVDEFGMTLFAVSSAIHGV